jgi:Na+/proline symporter
VQRLLTCRDLRDSQKALVTSGFIVLLQFVLFLGVGIMLFAYYQHLPPPTLTSNDQIFPAFIVSTLPHGVSGLVIAAIFAAAMSNLSGSLNSLASTTVLDFYNPLTGGRRSDAQLLALSKWCTAGWGVVLIGIAIVARGWGSVFTAGLTAASIIYGPMVGAFLLGVLTRRATATGVITGMVSSAAVMLTIWWTTKLAWTWYVLVGAAICVGIGYAVSSASSGTDPRLHA